MEDVQTLNNPGAVENPPVETTATSPFALDENALLSLSPEQRAGLDPIIDSWKKKATEEISRRETEASNKYKPLEEKAQALDKLTQYQPFVQWWQAQQKQAVQGASATERQSINQTKPQDIATQTEWQEAIYDASQGDGTKLQNLQARMMATWATPLVREITEKQQKIDTQLELRDLFETHPDAKDLDLIGIDSKTKEGVSLLEMGLEWAERNKRPLEDGYNLAARWRDQLKLGAQQQAMGLVNGKRQEITQGPSTSSANSQVVEVENAEDLIKRSLEAQLSGQKDVKFVIKGSK